MSDISVLATESLEYIMLWLVPDTTSLSAKCSVYINVALKIHCTLHFSPGRDNGQFMVDSALTV